MLAALCLFAFLQPGFCAVGFVTLTITNGYSFIHDPFVSTDGSNSVNSILTNTSPRLPDGTQVYQWVVTNQSFSAPSLYSATNNKWSTNYLFPPGKGIVIGLSSTNAVLITFVGTVLEGLQTNLIAGSNKFSLVGFKEPFSGSLENSSLSFPLIPDGTVLTYNTNSQSFRDPYTYFGGYGWFDPNHVVGTNGPVINLAQSFFVQNPGADVTWSVSFSFHAVLSPHARTATSSSGSPPDISSLSVDGTSVTLNITNPAGGAYDVQYSSDRVSWYTVASAQTGATWSAPRPGGTEGYYQVVSH